MYFQWKDGYTPVPSDFDGLPYRQRYDHTFCLQNKLYRLPRSFTRWI